MASNAEKVRAFTEESSGISLVNAPEPMTLAEVTFIIKMTVSELTELAQTVTPGPGEAMELVRLAVGTDVKQDYIIPGDKHEFMAHQYDAFVDVMYYMYNAAAKKGVNLDKLFGVVHDANMKKRWSDGSFHRDSRGKVIKPPGYQEADVRSGIVAQAEHGAF